MEERFSIRYAAGHCNYVSNTIEELVGKRR